MARKATLLGFDQSRPASANGVCQPSQSLERCSPTSNAVAEMACHSSVHHQAVLFGGGALLEVTVARQTAARAGGTCER